MELLISNLKVNQDVLKCVFVSGRLRESEAWQVKVTEICLINDRWMVML